MANIKLTMDDSTKSDPELPRHLCFQLQPLMLTLEQSQGVCLHIIELTDHEQAKGPIRSGVVNTEGSGFPSRRPCPVECAYWTTEAVWVTFYI